MNRLFFKIAAIAACVTFSIGNIAALPRVTKEKKSMAGASEKDVKYQARKAAAGGVSSFKKEGWDVYQGQLNLKMQLERTYVVRYTYLDRKTPAYVMGEAVAAGENIDRLQPEAFAAAREEMLQVLLKQVKSKIKKGGFSGKERKVLYGLMDSCKEKISTAISNANPVLELYRKTKDGRREVLVVTHYELESALKAVSGIFNEELAGTSSQMTMTF